MTAAFAIWPACTEPTAASAKRFPPSSGSATLFSGIGIRDVLWLLDKPVSNSGRLRTLIEQTAADKGWPWQVELVPSPDKQLADTDRIALTSDSDILDKCRRWSNAMPFLLQSVSPLWLMDLMDTPTFPAAG